MLIEENLNHYFRNFKKNSHILKVLIFGMCSEISKLIKDKTNDFVYPKSLEEIFDTVVNLQDDNHFTIEFIGLENTYCVQVTLDNLYGNVDLEISNISTSTLGTVVYLKGSNVNK